MSWWHDLPADEPFGLDNLPYGVADFADGPRVVVRVANHALDIARLAELTTRNFFSPIQTIIP